MDNLTAWQIWIHDNTVVVVTLAVLAFGLLVFISGLLVKLSITVWNQRRELEQSELGRLADKIGELVDQVQHLFQKQDITVTSIDQLGDRVATLEKKVGQHFVRCNERERLVMDIKDKQDKCQGSK